MRIHLVYATYSSGTLSAAEYMVQMVLEKGHEVTLINVHDIREQDLTSCDLLILGSPSWERADFKYNGQPHIDFFTLFRQYGYDVDVPSEVRQSSLDLAGQRAAIFGLGDTKYPIFCGAVDHLADFLTRSRGSLVGVPLRIDGYYFDVPAAESALSTWLKTLGVGI